MKNIAFIQEKLTQLLGVGIVCAEDIKEELSADYPAHNPIYHSNRLLRRLIAGANGQERPYIYKDEHQVFFACIHYSEKHYLIGPMCVDMPGRVELHRFYREYGIEEAYEKRLKHYTITEVLSIVELLAAELHGVQYSDEELLYVNHLAEDMKEKVRQEQMIFSLQEVDEELYHHTYQEERKLLECVREGRVQEAIRYSKNMDVDLGKLSTRELNHWKNVTIAAVTLCTRAAIEGGLSPAIAYRLSDFYIQKSDSCTDIAQVIECRNRAVEEMARRVWDRRQRHRTSSYVERCKDYIEGHYRRKIYQEEMAAMLGISPSYLSRLFHKEMGMCLRDYIVQVRVEHAANLLMYSDESIAKIAEYVNFPSQSYFGKVFKEQKQMSPRKFRETRKPSGF